MGWARFPSPSLHFASPSFVPSHPRPTMLSTSTLLPIVLLLSQSSSVAARICYNNRVSLSRRPRSETRPDRDEKVEPILTLSFSFFPPSTSFSLQNQRYYCNGLANPARIGIGIAAVRFPLRSGFERRWRSGKDEADLSSSSASLASFSSSASLSSPPGRPLCSSPRSLPLRKET